MSYNSRHPQKHPFEVAETSLYGGQLFYCPVCRIRRWDNAMRIHIAKQARKDHFKGGGAHLDYYHAHTHEVVITKRVWDI